MANIIFFSATYQLPADCWELTCNWSDAAGYHRTRERLTRAELAALRQQLSGAARCTLLEALTGEAVDFAIRLQSTGDTLCVRAVHHADRFETAALCTLPSGAVVSCDRSTPLETMRTALATPPARTHNAPARLFYRALVQEVLHAEP